MIRPAALCLLLLCLGFLTSCRQQDDKASSPVATENATAKLPEPDGAQLVQYITETEDYREWPLFPGTDRLYKGQHPHGAFLTTFVSPATLKALQGESGRLPDGAIVVKENYSPEKELAAVTVMYRRSGYNPEAGDWFWVKYGPDRSIMAEGKVAGCIDCHRSARNNDWIFTGTVK